jgi:predicted RecB family nuclease
MRITSPLFDAFLKCATKCHLRSLAEIGSGNEYAEWVRVRDESYQHEAARALQEALPETERVAAPPATENLKAAKWRLAVDLVAQTPDKIMDSSLGADATLTDETHPSPCPLPAMRGEGGRRPGEGRFIESPVPESRPSEETRGLGVSQSEQLLVSRLHAVERVPSEGRGKSAQFIPIRFVFRNKLTKDDRLLLAFDALVLSEVLGRQVSLGRIIHGDDHATLKVKTSALTGEVRKRVEKMTALLSSPAPPDLVLNRHCAECEFQSRCRKIALEKDDLSLLATMSAKERQKLRSEGIFTVTQLSYTFRPRRRPKRLRDKREKYHHSLKALAIREKKIHIVGSPELKIEGTPVYLDVEGLPDRNFYYLIGLRIGNGESAVQHSLWADTVEDEGRIWREFLGILETIEKPVLVHYGSYETTFLKRMCELHGGPAGGSDITTTIQAAVNVVPVLFAHIYFPTYTNGLKDIGESLDFKWSEPEPAGLRTIVWRHFWEESKSSHFREKVVTYNAEDCEALEVVIRATLKIGLSQAVNKPIDNWAANVVHAESIPRETMFGRFSSPITEFEQINEAARWDYQRDRVYVRSSQRIRRIAAVKTVARKRLERRNKVVVCPDQTLCPRCGSRGYRHFDVTTKILHDVFFGRDSLKKWVVEYRFHDHWCRNCRTLYGTPSVFWPETKFGRNLVAYIVYQAIELAVPQITIKHCLNRIFGFNLVQCTMPRLKARAADYYGDTRQKILDKITRGDLAHVDETRANVKGKTGYVWVFTNLHEVAYLYSDSREGEIAHATLANFKGVLVSDFYSAYDSFACPQQKCLIHLMRDLNDEVLDLPFDEEFKRIVMGFAEILKLMVESVDRYGLKKHFLRRHLKSVDRFYRQIGNANFQSEAAMKCRERFEKNRDKLFTFLEYDGIPWNNNNAEHAIRAFAALRDVMSGSSTQNGLEGYLILLSVCQTCKYMGVDFLNFLRSGEKDIHAFAESRRGRRRRAQANQADGLPADAIPGPQESPLTDTTSNPSLEGSPPISSDPF